VTRTLVIPAAGLGTRLGRASRPKLLVEVAGRPMLDRLLAQFAPFVERAVVVVHPAFEEQVRAHPAAVSLPLELVQQAEPTGMLDAILLALPRALASAPERVWVVWCDQVTLRRATLESLATREGGPLPVPGLLMPTARVDSPYIHLARDADGRVVDVLHRREGDALPERGESDVGLFSLSARACREPLREFADTVAKGRATAERNFLPFIPWMAARDELATLPVAQPIESMGVNTPAELARAEAELVSRESP